MAKPDADTKEAAKSGELPWYSSSRGWAELFVRHSGAVLGAVVLLGGWTFILAVNQWHVGAPAVFLCAGWAAAIGAVRFLWNAGIASATEGAGADDEGFDLRESQRDELLREKRALLKAIKDIEFDRDLGKMSAEDAADLVRVYRSRAIEVIKALEGVSDDELPLEERIARDLEARLQVMPTQNKKRAQLLAAAKSDQDQAKAKGKKRRRPAPADTLSGDTTPTGRRRNGTNTTLPGGTARRAFADDMLADAEADEELFGEGEDGAKTSEDRAG